MSHRLLRQYIRSSLLTEDIDVGITHELYGGWGSATGADLKSVFFGPFTDVLSTAAGAGKKIAARATTLFKVALETIKTSLIPFLDNKYKEIFAAEQQALNSIQGQYKDVYDRTRKALSNDALMFGFLAAPAVFLSAKGAAMAPDTLRSLLSVASGGVSDKYLGTSEGGSSSVKEAKIGRWRLIEGGGAKEILDLAASNKEIKEAIKENSGRLQDLFEEIIAVKSDSVKQRIELNKKMANPSPEDIKNLIKPEALTKLKEALTKEFPEMNEAQRLDILNEKLPEMIASGAKEFLQQANQTSFNAFKELMGNNDSAYGPEMKNLKRLYGQLASSIGNSPA